MTTITHLEATVYTFGFERKLVIKVVSSKW